MSIIASAFPFIIYIYDVMLGDLSEKNLIILLKKGDHASFRHIFDMHKIRLNNNIRNLVRDNEATDEILQRTFVKLWEYRENLDPEKPLIPYLNTIARNEVYNFWREILHKRTLEEKLSNMEQAVSTADEDNEEFDSINNLFSLADDLPEKRKKIFQMRFMEMMSYKEIACHLEISENTVQNQIAASLKHIRKKLKYTPVMSFFIFFQ